MESSTPDRQTLQESPQPLYVQIKETLRQRILDGTYQPHQKLPSESELTRRFGVSRITIRQALRDLHNEGLIFSSQGKGSFVSKPKAVQNVRRLEGFGEAMAAQGYEATARVVSIEEMVPPKNVRDALDLGGATSSSVVEVKRVRYLNRVPVSLEISYFPLDVGRPLFNQDLSGDIFPILENLSGIPLGAANISIDAGLANSEVQKELGLSEADPVLQVERLTHDRSGRPIDYEFLFFSGDSFKYRFEIDRS